MNTETAKYLLDLIKRGIGRKTVEHILEEAAVPCRQDWEPDVGQYVCDKCRGTVYNRTRFCPHCGKEVGNYD